VAPSDADLPTVVAKRLEGLEDAERRARRVSFMLDIYRTVVVTGVAIVAAVGAINAAHTANRLDDCLVAGGGCYERMARSGQLGSNRQIDFVGCLLLVEPQIRTDADLRRCLDEANAKFFRNIKDAAKGD